MLQRVFKAFQYRDFRLMWIGACTSTIGTWMQLVAQQWLVYTLSKDDPFFLGLDGFLGQIPIVLFSLLGGVMADRTDRRKMLLGSQYVQTATALTLAALYFAGVVHVWHILVLSFIVGSAQSFGGPAYSALIPSLVPKENLPNAIALNSIQFNVGRVIGPALGGITLATLGAGWCFGLNGISFVAVIISLYIIRTGFTPAKSTESVLTSMKQGIAFIRTQEGMKPLIVMSFLMTMMAIPLITFLPVFAKEVLHGDSKTFTALLCCSGIGSIFGALMVAGMAKTKNQGRTALLMLIVLGFATLVFSRSTSTILSCVMIFFAGASMITVFASITSLVQAITADSMRGRVMSVYNVAFRGGMPFGMLIVGRLIPIYTAPLTMSVVGVLTILLGLYFLLVQRRISAL
ncbi:MAG TPA: MFS transporter [Bryobacteraceae bacterium]|nr:MFS transporter [Bryobacteraceae bacterium]